MVKTITIGSASAKPGEVARGVINAGEMRNNSRIEIPVVVVNGEGEGPVILLAAGAHPPEIAAIEALRRVIREEVKPSRLKGTIIALPVQNPLAYEVVDRVSPQDSGNISGMYPGNPNGSITQRIAWAIWNEAVMQSNYVVDLHCISLPGIHYIIMYDRRGKTAETNREQLDLINAYGVTVCKEKETGPAGGWRGKFSNECLENGIPSFIVELTDTRSIVERSVEPGVTGIMNVLKHLKMVEGEPRKQSIKVVNPGHIHTIEDSIRANRSGTLNIMKQPGDLAKKGEVIAVIRNLYGDDVERVTLPFDGYVSCYSANSWVGYQAVGTGDFVADVFRK